MLAAGDPIDARPDGAVIAKLLSESIEAIDLGVLEATRASGGNWREMVKFAVLPQVLPHYVSYALYAFELNIRASMVLGLVGAGGIGMVLEAQRTTFQYARVSLILLAVFFVPIVGLGAFAGTLAIGLHYIGMLGKLGSDVIESMDTGPVEAVRASGGSGLAALRYRHFDKAGAVLLLTVLAVLVIDTLSGMIRKRLVRDA